MFLLGILVPRANEKGLYVGMIACILFTAWATLTTTSHEVNGTKQLLWDLGNLNFPHHTYMLGVYSHFVLFFVGWGASYLFKGKSVDKNLLLYGIKKQIN
jgi:SSS family solute:Na+ symporter